MRSILEDRFNRNGIDGRRCFYRAASILLLCWLPAQGASITLAWDPSPASHLAAYVVHYGLASGRYDARRVVATNNTTATIDNLVAGRTYYFMVTAREESNVESLPSNEVFTKIAATPTASSSRLTVLEQGNGTVTPDLDGQDLLVGHVYKITAVPDAGSIFTGWTGGVTSSAPGLSFVMASNLVLTANFMTNPYLPIAGSYNGLFYEAAEVRMGRSGFVAVKATGKGAYSGKLILGQRTHAFSGRLDVNGKGTNLISRPDTNALTVELDFNDGGLADQVKGRVTDGAWSAVLSGDRACFDARTNRAPYAGSYTLVVPGTNNLAAGPEGDGFGTVKVDGRGGVIFAGSLADGSKATQKVTLSRAGIWPFYLALYRGQGAVLGWQTFSNGPGADISGLVSWIRPGQPASKHWPSGFTNDASTIGSAYVAPGFTNRVLACTQCDLTFTGGDIGANLTNVITLDTRNKILAEDANGLSMAITLKSGLFSGTVLEPLSGKRLTFKGAVLQKQNGGAGFLLGTNRSARVAFGL